MMERVATHAWHNAQKCILTENTLFVLTENMTLNHYFKLKNMTLKVTFSIIMA